MTAAHLIERFHLVPHPEGGYYARTHTAPDGSFSSILFLLTRDSFSAFHRISSAEQWNWYFGDAILIHELDTDGNYHQTILSDRGGMENFQYVVPAGHWFASESMGDMGFALCGCTVVPAFRFEDFELAEGPALTATYPQHKNLISKLTRK